MKEVKRSSAFTRTPALDKRGSKDFQEDGTKKLKQSLSPLFASFADSYENWGSIRPEPLETACGVSRCSTPRLQQTVLTAQMLTEADHTSASDLGSPADSPGLRRTGTGRHPESQSTPPKTSEAPADLAVRTVDLPLYGTWKPAVSGGAVGKRVAMAKKSCLGGASASAKNPAVYSRPKTAPDVRKRKPLRSAELPLGEGSELRTAFHESGGSQTGEPCSKRRHGGFVPDGDPTPQRDSYFSESGLVDAPPLLQPFLSLPRGWSPGSLVAADVPRTNGTNGTNGSKAPEVWCLQKPEGRRSVESTGRSDGPLGGRKVGLGLGEQEVKRETPFQNSWPVDLQFRPGGDYLVLGERSAGSTVAVSWVNAPHKTGFCEANPLAKDVVNNANRGLRGANAGAGYTNDGFDDLRERADDLTASITALLTDHMRALLDAQEAQLGPAGTECPVELTPGQVAKILNQQEQMRAALAYFKTLTGPKPTGLSPSAGGAFFPGKPSLSGTQSYASETACRVVPVGETQSGLENRVTRPVNGFGGELSSAYEETERALGLAEKENGREKWAQDPRFVPLASGTPLEALAEPAEHTWQLDGTCFGGEWSAQGHVAAPLWGSPFAEQIGLGSLF
ncbi:hypothetical protein KFL_002180190 [Klebsormidium nitens]|uniref:Uncharacterized protein n=1 Tax=Klebsormidium nitens TaxID=105231 RepID=A0A1Y1I299_KLENI|nr:hypothetical protein KFL_002180190 [Klebsormidium nitens]|eukprot:GAQ85045.1 hypothetical protein KFL_002180190 [Klebsormidium nitens]